MARLTLDDFPHPYCNLPTDGKPLTMLDVHDTVVPLLDAVRGILEAFAAAAGHDELPTDNMSPAFSVLAGQLALAVTLMEHLQTEPLKKEHGNATK